MLRFIFLAFVFYLLYQLVFKLIIPVSKATSQVKDKMSQMQEQQAAQMRQQQAAEQQRVKPEQTSIPRKEDYIDFEEVKE
jgi:predicted Holliday junction resolvase-like endonuclease